MLTSEQTRNLGTVRAAPQFARFSGIIDAAISGWHTITPSQGRWGVVVRDNGVYGPSESACGCIVGASLLGKSSRSGYVKGAADSYKLSIADIEDLATGFDQLSPKNIDNNPAAHACGQAVAAALGFIPVPEIRRS